MIITQPRLDFPLLETPANAAASQNRRSFDFSISVEEEDQVLNFLNSKLVRKGNISLTLYIFIDKGIVISAQVLDLFNIVKKAPK